MCSSGITNKLMHVEKTLSLLPRTFCSLQCFHLATTITAILSAKQFKACFLVVLNNGTNAGNLMSANVCKMHRVIHLNTLLP